MIFRFLWVPSNQHRPEQKERRPDNNARQDSKGCRAEALHPDLQGYDQLTMLTGAVLARRTISLFNACT